VLAALVAALTIVLVAPSAALACTGISAACVYTQQNDGPGGSRAVTPGQASLPVSKHLRGLLGKAGKNASEIQAVATSPGLNPGHIEAIAPTSVSTPSAFSALFDLGPGPLALIAVLVGSAVLLAAGSGWRGWRRWRGDLAG
jgi:hypothetical protein